MIEIFFTSSFTKQVKSAPTDLQEEILERIDLLKDRNNHKILKIHKLHGRLKDRYSFYVNYKLRIVFTWENEKEVILLAMGDHDIYKT